MWIILSGTVAGSYDVLTGERTHAKQLLYPLYHPVSSPVIRVKRLIINYMSRHSFTRMLSVYGQYLTSRMYTSSVYHKVRTMS